MNIYAHVDIRIPLKQRKILILSNRKHHFVRFEYEKLTILCFLFGKLGHGESFCSLCFTEGGQDLSME
ncbi:hypothetical protein GQ457_10G014300 [Hibiscus cannabinus]